MPNCLVGVNPVADGIGVGAAGVAVVRRVDADEWIAPSDHAEEPAAAWDDTADPSPVAVEKGTLEDAPVAPAPDIQPAEAPPVKPAVTPAEADRAFADLFASLDDGWISDAPPGDGGGGGEVGIGWHGASAGGAIGFTGGERFAPVQSAAGQTPASASGTADPQTTDAMASQPRTDGFSASPAASSFNGFSGSINAVNSTSATTAPSQPSLTPAAAQNLLDNQPLSFESNVGQFNVPERFVVQGQGYDVALGAAESQFVFPGSAGQPPDTLNVQLVGANAAAQATGQNELATKTNYLVGNDPGPTHQLFCNLPCGARISSRKPVL